MTEFRNILMWTVGFLKFYHVEFVRIMKFYDVECLNQIFYKLECRNSEIL